MSHSNNVDDEYERMFIPKGSVIVCNVWAILHDEKVSGANADKFDPDRFMSGNNLNPSVPHPDAAFGFGRRICAGKHIAESSLWIAIASILSTLDIGKKLDEIGQPITPPGNYTSGLVV